MFYTVYKTTHLETGKIYIGMHQTKKADDSYLGSGTLISRAIEKHGREVFSKEVLFVFATPEEMIAKEKELVSVEFVLRDDTYNLNVGGDGGWYRANQVLTAEKFSEIQRKGRLAAAIKCQSNEEVKAKLRANGKLQMKALHESGKVPYGNWKDRQHSEESKARIGRANAVSSLGVRNSQYGTCWINIDGSPKKVPRSDIDFWVSQGWAEGRKPRILRDPKPRGGRESPKKLTNEKVDMIRDIYTSAKVSQQALGKQFGVSQYTISCIVRRRTWK